MATLQLKRGTSSRWSGLNLILAAGEPGFVTDENRLKIGDGVTLWNDLPYIGEGNVVNAQTRDDFPILGRADVLYKAETEKTIYQWNPTELTYEALNAPLSDELLLGKIDALTSELDDIVARVVALEAIVENKVSDADLATIAKTGNVADLVQTNGDYIIFNCGSAGENV